MADTEEPASSGEDLDATHQAVNQSDCYIPRTVRKKTVIKPTLLHRSVLAESVTVIHSTKKDISAILLSTGASFNTTRIHDLLAKLKSSKTPIYPDKNEKTLFDLGDIHELGCCSFNGVGLRFGQDDKVLGIRVRSRRDGSSKSPRWCLLLSDRVKPQDVAILSKFNESQHYFRVDNDGKIRWTKSEGDMEVVRSHLDDNDVVTVQLDKVTDFDEKVVLLSGEPGTGKTTLVTRITECAKTDFPKMMVVLVPLSEHARLFDNGTYKDPVGFLTAVTDAQKAGKNSQIQLALDAGNLVVVLDGFDQVVAPNVKQCCTMMTSLLETSVKSLWITTRRCKQRYLEDHLSVLAMTLDDFKIADQTSLLKQSWSSDHLDSHSTLPNDEVDDVIARLLKMTSQCISARERDMAGNALQTCMMADVFASHVAQTHGSKAPDKMDLIHLYASYFAQKRDAYLQSAIKVDPGSDHYDVIRMRNGAACDKNLEHAAIWVVLGDTDLKELRPRTDKQQLVDFYDAVAAGRDTTGIVHAVIDGAPHFAHSTFAEYFAAQWFVKRRAHNPLFLKNVWFAQRFAPVRSFLDRLLARDCALHVATLNVDLEEVRALLRDGVHVDDRDLGGRTALHLAAGLGLSDDREENGRRGEILDALIRQTNDFGQEDEVLGGSPLRHADLAQAWTAIDALLACSADTKDLATTTLHVNNRELMEYVVTHDLDRLMHFCLTMGFALREASNDGTRLLPLACQHGSVRVAALLIANGAQIEKTRFEVESPLHIACKNGHLPVVRLLREANCAALDGQERTPLHWAAIEGHLDVVKALVGGVPEGESRKNFLDMVDKDGWTSLHHAVSEGYPGCLRYIMEEGGDVGSADDLVPLAICNNRGDSGVVRILLKSNPEFLNLAKGKGSSLLLLAAEKCENYDIVKTLLDMTPSKDRAEWVNTGDVTGNTPVHLASKAGVLDSVGHILKRGGKVTTVNYYGRTPLMEASLAGSVSIVKLLLTYVNKEGVSKFTYIDKKDKNDRSALQYAAVEGHPEVVELLLKEQAQKGNFTKLLNLAVQSVKANPNVVDILLNSIPADERADCVNTADELGNSSVHWSAMHKCPEILEHLVNAGGRVSAVNKNKHTPLMLAAIGGNKLVVKHILKSFDDDKEAMDMAEFVGMRDKDGETALELACKMTARSQGGVSVRSSASAVVSYIKEAVLAQRGGSKE